MLESQFDENQKFKQILVEQITDLNTLRSQPIGRDKDGYYYWFYMDKDYSIRIFNYLSPDKEESAWKLVCKELEQFKELVEKLSAEPALAKLLKSKRYQQTLEKEKKLKEQKLKEEGKLVEVKANEDVKVESEEKIEVKVEVNEAEKVVEPAEIKEEVKQELKEEKKEEKLEHFIDLLKKDESILDQLKGKKMIQDDDGDDEFNFVLKKIHNNGWKLTNEEQEIIRKISDRF